MYPTKPHNFRMYFNRRRQWVDVYLHDVHPSTFQRRDGGRWAYLTYDHPYRRKGKFGELHFVASRWRRLRLDTVAHELQHLTIRLFISRNGILDNAMSADTEERICTLNDELTRAFWREYVKSGGKIRA